MVLKTQEEVRLKGVPICRGISIGKPFFLHAVEEEIIMEFTVTASGVEEEIVRYRRALALCCNDIKRLQKQLEQEQILDGVAILEAQLQILQDPLITENIENEVSNTKKNIESVFQKMIAKYQKKFDSLNDPFFKERFKDLQDISKQVMGYLCANIRISLAKIPLNSIVFARDLSVSDAAKANCHFVKAFITQFGGETSHAAIIAMAKGIPYVSGIDFEEMESIKNRDSDIIVDGRTGGVILNPSIETLGTYQNIHNQLQAHLGKLECMSSLSTETYDGYQVHLSANIEKASELDVLHQFSGSGVGLFRSEYIFLSKGTFPSEEEQFIIYQDLVKKMNGLPIVMRVFDVGGDKFVPNQENQQVSCEGNPFLGCRAIRFLLKEREIFKVQLRAILRASIYGNVSILFPMISTLSELLEAKSIIKEVEEELSLRGEGHKKHIRVGCMVEVPSAALICDLLAQECDFLSIGTNDLIQYSLAVDRGNHAMNFLYTPTHPSVIRLIKMIVNEANHCGIPVTVCGEVAADPRFTPLLLGLGIHGLSVAPRYIPTIKNAIRHTSIVAASQLAEAVLALTTADEIKNLLAQEYKKNVSDDCFYNYN